MWAGWIYKTWLAAYDLVWWEEFSIFKDNSGCRCVYVEQDLDASSQELSPPAPSP